MARELKQLEEAGEPDWGDLEDLLASFARLVKSEVPFSRVARDLVDCLIDALAAVGAALWLVDEPGTLRLERHVNIGALGENALAGDHHRLLVETLHGGQAEVIAPHQAGPGPDLTAYTLLIVPMVIDTDAVGLVEVIQRPTIDSNSLDGNLRFTALLTELATDHLRRREVRDLREGRRRTGQFEDLLHSLHRSLDPKATASELANEGRRHIGCDRVSVAVRRGRRYRLVAVSSVDVINRRSVAVMRLQRLIARVAATGEEFWFEGPGQTLAPQLEDALSKYLDETHARSLGVVPLRVPKRGENDDDGAVIGALVVECFDAHRRDLTAATTSAVARHGALALANALRYRSLPTVPFLRSRHQVSGESSQHLLKALAILILITAAASTLLVKMDYDLHVQGELQPAARNHIFAPLDGQVSIVSVAHGDGVSAGQVLVELSSPELDLEIQKIQGEHAAMLQRSFAIESSLLDYSSSVDPELARVNKLAAEQQELRQLFASQKQRLDVLRKQREKLLVRSPIAGEVLTWETDQQLLDRPVRRGQRMMTVADLEGPWEAELRVPDDRVGPLLKLFDADQRPPPVSFELATERGVEHQGEILRVARRTEVDIDNRPVVRVAMQVDNRTLANPRPGTTVFAKIHCGRRTIFYVWCHDLVDRVKSWLNL
jgi:multidrug efflux pump subunit AcrA (membrane-fusion protein)